MAIMRRPPWFTLYLVCFAVGVSGSKIALTSNSTDIFAGLTHQLTLMCAVTNTSVTSGAIVGRDVTANNIDFLTSLVVMRNGSDHVAIITEHRPAKALLDQHNLHVSGQVSGATAQLNLTWQQPTDLQAAVYTCEANGLTSQGHGVSLSTSLEVSLKTPEANDLVPFLRRQQENIDALNHNIEQLTQQNLHQNKTINLMEEDMNRLRHVETGVIDCGNDNYYGNYQTMFGHATRYIKMHKSFNTAYPRPPVVHLGIQSLGNYHDHDTVFFIELADVDERGFQMRCRTYTGYNRIYGMTVSWLSIPQ